MSTQSADGLDSLGYYYLIPNFYSTDDATWKYCAVGVFCIASEVSQRVQFRQPVKCGGGTEVRRFLSLCFGFMVDTFAGSCVTYGIDVHADYGFPCLFFGDVEPLQPVPYP